MKKPLATLLALLLAGSLALLSFQVSSAMLPKAQKLIAHPVLYVLAGGTSKTCSSWADACELQVAIALAQAGDVIWVGAGTYTPVSTTSDPREATFELRTGVAIYGGFPTIGGVWKERDWMANLTTLSGDIGIVEDFNDNSYHVVIGKGVDAAAILDGFTISGGNADGAEPHNCGGGMYNDIGSPTLTNVTFSENLSSRYGGGMYNNYSSPALTNVTFMKNSASIYGGGMDNWNSSPTLINVFFTENSAIMDGGGMSNYNSSPMLTNVTFTGNTAADYGGGLVNWSSSPTLTNVNFSGNAANGVSGAGGGMYNDASSPTLTIVTFAENHATNGGGGMYNNYSSLALTNVTFSTNTATIYGGGMVNWSSSPALTNVTFSANLVSIYGGGMYNSGSSPVLNNVTFSANSAASGGGMYNWSSSPALTKVTFSGNSATTGGGMYNVQNSNPTLTNVTISNNTSSYGGGMINYSSSPILTNVTFSANSADDSGDGMYNLYYSNPSLTNVIVWGNMPDQFYNNESTPIITFSDIQGCSGSDAWDTTCGTDLGGNIDSDPLLGPLVDNGGFTLTRALGNDSPAIDTGDPNNCPSSDQRGFYRPIDGNKDGTAKCDMGAYEFGSISLYLPLITR